MQLALNLGMNRRFILETPLMWRDKAATWELARSLGGDALVELIRVETHSCYLGDRDRKSTRLNSSHLVISYAVFCLKKKINVLYDRTFTSAATAAPLRQTALTGICTTTGIDPDTDSRRMMCQTRSTILRIQQLQCRGRWKR